MSKLGKLGVVAAGFIGLVVAPSQAHAVLGGQLFATSGTITVELLANDAGFTNDLRLFTIPPAPAGGTHLLFNTDPVGSTVVFNSDVGGSLFPAGTFAGGEELIFGIVVTGEAGGPFTYQMGPASRNPDNFLHADVTPNGFGGFDVGFEDLFGGGDQDYNDTRFRFTGVTAEQEPVIPEPSSLLLLGLGTLGAGFVRGRKKS